ncbi:MAG TPA: type II toxin-antitoxin system HipA family toxin [Labilithrix sp.]|nr:type II toxin-antitoxin system HipA family toxin [Labilithrix sp.]
MAQLVVFLGDYRVGQLTREARGGLSFAYDDAWRDDPDAYPLSVSMPLARQVHGGALLEAYLWGLLPDNEAILEGWARRFKVSARNPFALLASVGEDCPGAVRFVDPARLDGTPAPRRGAVAWLDERAVAQRLAALHQDASAWRAATDSGQFSLGGAQPKTALYFDGRRWGVPSGRTPTTHILKPGAPHLDGHAENEHFCLALGAEAGLTVARSQVLRFHDEVAIVLERYDRLQHEGAIVRVHQEDGCQALGVPPVNKYENAGGPGVGALVTLLRERSRHPREDLDTLFGALAFNWVIAGTDAHAKNYSLLIGRGGAIRLAPLYDIASFLPYAGTGMRKLKLAMAIGGKYRLHEIGVHAWSKLALQTGRDPEALRAELIAFCTRLPDLTARVAKRAKREGLSHAVLPGLAAKIQERARACVKALDP